MTTEGRWKRAQKYELDFWKRNEDLLPERGGKPPKHLDFVEDGEALADKRVLEIGCGPMGVIYYLSAKERVGLDPLARDYMNAFGFDARGVSLLSSMGEHLPFADHTFDVVVIGNVLDHVYQPDRTLNEARRILKPGGRLIVWMHVIPRWMRPMRMVLNAIDGGHPHHMTEAEANKLFTDAQLHPTLSEAVPPALGWTNGWKAAMANITMRNLLLKAETAREPVRANASP